MGGEGGGGLGVLAMTADDTRSQSAAVGPDNVLLNQSTPFCFFLFLPTLFFKAACRGPAHFILFFFFYSFSVLWNAVRAPQPENGGGVVGRGWGISTLTATIRETRVNTSRPQKVRQDARTSRRINKDVPTCRATMKSGECR